MSAIFYKNLPYGAGGSNVEANPSGSATDDLEKIGIDGTVYDVTDADAIHSADKGVNNGVASLDSNGKVPSSQLPSYVDDVVEGYYDGVTDRFYEESTFTTVIPPTDGKSWVDITTNKSYRWTGSVYVRVDEGVQLGTTHSSAAYGDDAVSTAEPSFSEASTRANLAGSGEKLSVILGKIKKWFTDLKDLAFIGKDGNNSKKYLRGDGTWQSIFEGSVVGDIQIKDNDSGFTTTIYAVNDSLTGLNLLNVPDKSGTIATTNDIPDVETAKTATGNPITLTDASESYAEELEVTLEPIQDLHGYDKPWVGGAGKNKLPVTLYSTSNNGITYSIDSDGIITALGTLTGEFSTVRIYQEETNNIPTGDYILNGCPSGYGQNLYLNIWDSATDVKDYGSGVSKNLVNGRRFYVAIVVRQSLSTPVKFKPMLRLSTETDPTFAPYSNICPITGYTDVNVGSVGKNLFDAENPYGGYTGTTSSYDENTNRVTITGQWYQAWIVNVKPNTNYTYSRTNISATASRDSAIYGVQSNGRPDTTDVIKTGIVATDNVPISWTFNSGNRNRIAILIYSGSSTSGTTVVSNIQVEEGTATTYEPYTSSTTHTPLGRTVYGGKLNVRTGKLVVDMISVDLSTLSFNRTSGFYYTTLPDAKKPASNSEPFNAYFDRGEVVGANGVNKANVVALTTTGALYITTSDYDGGSLVSPTGQLVYEKAAYDTIDTPPTDLKLLDGINTITTNGTTISLKYQPDNVIGEAISVSEEYTDRHFAWKKVGEYNTDGQDIVINGDYSEIMIVPFMGSSSRTAMNGVTYPFELFGTCDLAFLWDYLEGSYQTDASILKNKKLNGNHKIMVYVR